MHWNQDKSCAIFEDARLIEPVPFKRNVQTFLESPEISSSEGVNESTDSYLLYSVSRGLISPRPRWLLREIHALFNVLDLVQPQGIALTHLFLA